jgi:signal recognition particle subunit SRP54
MIGSMTPAERARPDLLAASPPRRRRVARGCGRREQDVAELVAVFVGMRSQMQGLSRMMALSNGLGGGLPGAPAMSDEEMMAAVLGGTGPREVAPGRVRRKRNFREAAAKAAAAVAAEAAGAGARA